MKLQSHSATTGTLNDEGVLNLMVKLGSFQYKCAVCDNTFKFSSNLRAHIESKHYSPGYKCAVCCKDFKIRKVYTQHLKKCAGMAWAMSNPPHIEHQ